MSTVDQMNHVEFYDLLNELDWNDWEKVEKAKRMANMSLEHKVTFIQFEAYVVQGTKKPEKPRI